MCDEIELTNCTILNKIIYAQIVKIRHYSFMEPEYQHQKQMFEVCYCLVNF